MVKLGDLIKMVVVASFMLFLAAAGARPIYKLNREIQCDSLYNMTECCLPYVTGIADQPSPECCKTVQRIKNMVNKREEVVQCCECFKAKAFRLQHLRESTLKSLPTDCGFSFRSDVTLDCDCSRIA